MAPPRTDLLKVITGQIPVTVAGYRNSWIVPAVTGLAVASWFAVLAAILTITH